MKPNSRSICPESQSSLQDALTLIDDIHWYANSMAHDASHLVTLLSELDSVIPADLNNTEGVATKKCLEHIAGYCTSLTERMARLMNYAKLEGSSTQTSTIPPLL